MLNFENIALLDKHIKYLNKKLKNKNIFLVGGSVRDILLGVENSPTDIDFTMAGNPTKIYNQIDKEDISHFMTEKFGTITLIKDEIKYELTPLRTESGYKDTRHPDKITRSDDIILDSARRDFTINCIYYFSTEYKFKVGKNKNIEEKRNYLDAIKEDGINFFPGLNILIIQKHDYIQKLFKDGIFQPDFLDYLLDITKNKTVIQGKSKNIEISSNIIRIIIDPFNGIQDIIIRKLQTCGNPDKRFQEDALRLIRAIRFVNVCNQKLQDQTTIKENKISLFDFEKETWISLKKNSKLIKNIAKERIKEELFKAFKNGNPFGFTALLDESSMLKYLFPSLAKTKKIEQPIRYHPFDVYAHTMLTLYQLQKINTDPIVRFAMLYHDVGKPLQFAEYKNGLSKDEIREIMAGPNNHRRSGPQLAKKDFSKLGFSSKEIIEVCNYIARHHKPEEILNATIENREKKLRKFLSDAGFDRVNNVFDIAIADRLGQYNPLQNSSDISDVRELKTQLKKLNDKEGQFTIKNLVIDGNDIIRYFKMKPGPIIGELIQKTLNRLMDDIKHRNKKEKILEFLRKYLKNKPI
ncbi:MAG: HD domain-containing protein [Candidatus Absconditicoccaceae bacterium]